MHAAATCAPAGFLETSALPRHQALHGASQDAQVLNPVLNHLEMLCQFLVIKGLLARTAAIGGNEQVANVLKAEADPSLPSTQTLGNPGATAWLRQRL